MKQDSMYSHLNPDFTHYVQIKKHCNYLSTNLEFQPTIKPSLSLNLFIAKHIENQTLISTIKYHSFSQKAWNANISKQTRGTDKLPNRLK